MIEEDNSIIFRICPITYLNKGHATLLVSMQDYETMAAMNWNMEKPGPEHSENLIKFKSPDDR